MGDVVHGGLPTSTGSCVKAQTAFPRVLSPAITCASCGNGGTVKSQQNGARGSLSTRDATARARCHRMVSVGESIGSGTVEDV